MKQTKEYTIPEEVIELTNKMYAFANLRDIYVKLPFGFKNAKKAAMGHERYRTKFWRMVWKLYPELQQDKLLFDSKKGVVVVDKGGK